MRFAIRDDDTNYFTRPEDLESVHGRFWDRCPTSIGVVPFHGRTPTGAIPRDCWSGAGTFPLHRNAALVAFLKRKIRQGRISVLMHGFDHVDHDGRPELARAAGVPEIEERIARGRDYLQDLLEVPVRTFVPPHNALSCDALEALSGLGMHALGTFSFRPGLRRQSPSLLVPMLLRRSFLWRQERRGWRGGFYPFALKVKGHREMACHNLNRDPACSLNELLAELAQTERVGGDFCLALHYWEMNDAALAEAMASLIRSAELAGAEFVHADELFEPSRTGTGGKGAA